MNIRAIYSIYQQHPIVVTDTRKLEEGCIFFALKGEKFNGNTFALKALELGAAYAIVDEEVDPSNNRLIKVDDVLTTLQLLAKHHRQQFDIPFIAITGSNGKTTTKELVNAVLSAEYITYCTEGNLNNHIGIPLTILRIKKDAEMAIVEMGANHQQEIAGYCTYALPTHGIITNCGKAHLEGFGGIEGVRKGKGELFDFLKQNHGTIFAYADYDYLKVMYAGISNPVLYGTEEGCILGNVISAEPTLSIQINQGFQEVKTITTQLAGDYNLPNVLCAVAIGKYFKVPEEKIVNALQDYQPSNNRSQWMEWKGNKVIMDAYNANPTSMKAAIQNMAALHAPHKYLLLGAMMELGEYSVDEHAAIITLLQQQSFTQVVLVGGDFAKLQHTFIYFATAAEAKDWLHQQNMQQSILLIKGSRSIGMEKIIP